VRSDGEEVPSLITCSRDHGSMAICVVSSRTVYSCGDSATPVGNHSVGSHSVSCHGSGGTADLDGARPATQVDRMIGLAKDGSLSSRRAALGYMYDKELVHSLFEAVCAPAAQTQQPAPDSVVSTFPGNEMLSNLARTKMV
jgi:hypothetical protein